MNGLLYVIEQLGVALAQANAEITRLRDEAAERPSSADQ